MEKAKDKLIELFYSALYLLEVFCIVVISSILIGLLGSVIMCKILDFAVSLK